MMNYRLIVKHFNDGRSFIYSKAEISVILFLLEQNKYDYIKYKDFE